jgi:hypothetical protein
MKKITVALGLWLFALPIVRPSNCQTNYKPSNYILHVIYAGGLISDGSPRPPLPPTYVADGSPRPPLPPGLALDGSPRPPLPPA